VYVWVGSILEGEGGGRLFGTTFQNLTGALLAIHLFLSLSPVNWHLLCGSHMKGEIRVLIGVPVCLQDVSHVLGGWCYAATAEVVQKVAVKSFHTRLNTLPLALCSFHVYYFA